MAIDERTRAALEQCAERVHSRRAELVPLVVKNSDIGEAARALAAVHDATYWDCSILQEAADAALEQNLEVWPTLGAKCGAYAREDADLAGLFPTGATGPMVVAKLAEWVATVFGEDDAGKGAAGGSGQEYGVADALDAEDMDILRKMLNTFSATSSDNRTKYDAIAVKIHDEHATGDVIKKRMQKLKRLGMTASKSGKGGGVWLSDKGVETAQKGT